MGENMDYGKRDGLQCDDNQKYRDLEHKKNSPKSPKNDPNRPKNV
jgi:hypothetical protein